MTQQKHFVRPAAGGTAAPERAKMAGFRLQKWHTRATSLRV